MRPRVFAVGAYPASGDVCQALAERGYAVVSADVQAATAGWKAGAAPRCIVIGSETDAEQVSQICRHVKLSRRLNGIAVVVLQAGSLAEPARNAVRVEPDIYVTEPLRPAALAEAVDSACQRVRERKPRGERFCVELVMSSSLSLLNEVAGLLQAILSSTPLGRKAASRVKYATLEMALNAIEWGNRWDRRKDVRFRLAILGDRFRATIRDEGPGFDPRQVLRARSSHRAGQSQFRGYGIRVCRQFVDELRYNERGNEVTLIKYFARASGK